MRVGLVGIIIPARRTVVAHLRYRRRVVATTLPFGYQIMQEVTLLVAVNLIEWALLGDRMGACTISAGAKQRFVLTGQIAAMS